jgi:hypothetical protein
MKAWLVWSVAVVIGAQGAAWAQAGLGHLRLPKPKPMEVKISRSIERVKDYEKVKGEARAKKKPVAFVMSEEGAKKGTLDQDTQLALQRARSMGVLIYVDVKELKSFPEKVGETAGSLRDALPAMIFADPETEEVIVAVGHNKEQNVWEKEIRDAKKTLSGQGPGAGEKPAKDAGKDTKKDTKKK